MTTPYIADPYAGRRRATREVAVGEVRLGAAHPIRIQSMTTTDTQDTIATADQTERLVDAGCEIVRITAPSIRDAENLAAIHAELVRRRVHVPLVADIHFTPNAAMEAALHVDKVRVNPGNYADKKRFEVREYSDAEYEAEIERVAERFRPLVLRCKELGRALRIGTNHGSLSDRILNRYGDTPDGMVESALEFLDVCEAEGFHDVVFSMKASNTQVAIQAYRRLAARLEERAPGEPSYPFHVGVTEAGDGDDGRVKSAIGIGALLEDGIGDTIRVSLTEDPVREVPVARALAARYDRRFAKPSTPAALDASAAFVADPFQHARRATRATGPGELAAGAGNPVRVEIVRGPAPLDPESDALELAAAFARVPEIVCEGLLFDAADRAGFERIASFRQAWSGAGGEGGVAVRFPVSAAPPDASVAARWVVPVDASAAHPHASDVARAARHAGVELEWAVAGELASFPEAVTRLVDATRDAGLETASFSAVAERPVHATRLLATALRAARAPDLPLTLRHESDAFLSPEAALLASATDLGAPLCDGLGDRVSLGGFGAPERDLALAYRILQGARLRTSWTEYISCPSCGRTLFDLEETTARVKSVTGHLRGVKIAVMGCVVNGPGEMADADFGYVGSGQGKVDLYVGQERVVRNVPEDRAPERLLDLIEERGGAPAG